MNPTSLLGLIVVFITWTCDSMGKKKQTKNMCQPFVYMCLYVSHADVCTNSQISEVIRAPQVWCSGFCTDWSGCELLPWNIMKNHIVWNNKWTAQERQLNRDLRNHCFKLRSYGILLGIVERMNSERCFYSFNFPVKYSDRKYFKLCKPYFKAKIGPEPSYLQIEWIFLTKERRIQGVYISFQNIPRKFHSHMAPMLLETGKSILTHKFMKLIIKAYVSKSDEIF